MGKPAAALETWRASEECIHCGSDAFESGWGPNTFIQCDCCLDRGTHVGCHENATSRALSREAFESPNFQWFCCHGCQRICRALIDETGRRTLLEGASSEYTTELVRYSTLCRGSQAAVKTALDIFHKAFQPLVMDNGMDLIDMVCKSHEDADAAEGAEEAEEEADKELYNFSNFRLFVLRKKGNIVTVATVRVFGTLFAEVPFVATREGYRREGNCRRLMRALDSLLHRLGVKWVILPAMKAVLHMWTCKFGYEQFSRAEVEVLEERVVMPDPDSAVLLRKRVLAPGAAAAAGAKRASKATAGAGKVQGRKVRFAEQPSYKEYSDSDEDRQKAGSGDESDGGSEAEEGGEGSSGDSSAGEENEPLACGRCGAEGKRLKEDPESGVLLCSVCLKSSGTTKAQPLSSKQAAPEKAAAAAGGPASEGPAAAAAGAGKAQEGAGQEGVDGKCCYNCGITAAVRWAKNRETGQDECHMCHNYRRKNNGKVRPPSAYRRTSVYVAWLKGGEKGAATAAAAAAAQRSQRQQRPSLKPAVRSACPQPVPSHHAAATAAGPVTPAALARRKRRLNPTLAAELQRSKDLQSQSAAKKELDTLMFDDQIARVLAGSVLNLVQQVDSSHAELLLDMEQRLGRLQLDKQGVEEAYAGLQAQHHAACTAQQAGTETAECEAAALHRRCEALEAALAQKDGQLAEKDARLAQFQQLFQQLLAGAGALRGEVGTQATPDLAVQLPSVIGVCPMPGSLAAADETAARTRVGAAEAAASGPGLSLVRAEVPEYEEARSLAMPATKVLATCPASQVTQQQQQQQSEQQLNELVPCPNMLAEPPGLAGNASTEVSGSGAGEQQHAQTLAAHLRPSQQEQSQEQQQGPEQHALQQGPNSSQGVPLGSGGVEMEVAETKQPSSKATDMNDGGTGSRRVSGTLWSEELFGMLATGLDSPEEDGADGLHTCGAEGVADSSQQRTQQLMQQQKQERQDTQHQDRQGGPGALPATAGAVGATAANTAPAEVSSEVMDLDSDGEHGGGDEAGQRLAAILEQSMGSQESQLRPPPAATCAPSGTMASPLRSAAAGPLDLESFPGACCVGRATSVAAGPPGSGAGDMQTTPAALGPAIEVAAALVRHGVGSSAEAGAHGAPTAASAEAAIAGLATRSVLGLLSPAEQLQALVEESQSQGAALPAPNDAAVALALDVAANLASDLDFADE
ncbi:hypothetical protein N2152v2_010386 [Parachlorella kessleri]